MKAERKIHDALFTIVDWLDTKIDDTKPSTEIGQMRYRQLKQLILSLYDWRSLNYD